MVHDLRKCPVVVGSPQTQTQRDQVTRVIRRLMTNTSFHRRTLSDIFSHAGAARLSVLMDEESQRSPRSENASVPFSTSREMDCRLVSECANSTGYDDDDDDVDEDEGVIAMGLDCLDCDNDLNFVDVSEVAENQSTFYPHYNSVMSSNQVTIDDIDSYIDSDESASVMGNIVHMNRNGSTAAAATVMTCQLQCHPAAIRYTANTASPSPAFADHHRRQNFQNLLEATDQCGVGVKDSIQHNEGTMDCNIQEKEQSMLPSRPGGANRDLDTLQGSSEQAACQHRQQQQHLVSMSSSACEDDPKQPHRNSSGHSRNMPLTSACMGNGNSSACVSSRTSAGSDLSSISPLAATDCASYDGRQTGIYLESEGILFQTRDQLSCPGDICSEQISQPSAVPTPTPPPASCRPSTASSSSSSSSASPGVLAGLRNFRLPWGGGGASAGAGHSSGQTLALAAHSDNKGILPSTPVALLNMAVSAAPGEFSGISPGSGSLHRDR